MTIVEFNKYMNNQFNKMINRSCPPQKEEKKK